MTWIRRKELLSYLKGQFRIDWYGYHGIAHWSRVRANGLMLAPHTGANVHVLELFSFFHDAGRWNESHDHGHGTRGAQLAKALKGRFFEASDDEMDLLVHACRFHSDGLDQGNVTVLSCWDADRLDLARVGVTPDSRYLCTPAARQGDLLSRAIARSLAWKQSETMSFTDDDGTLDLSLDYENDWGKGSSTA